MTVTVVTTNWTPERIRAKLATSDVMVERSILKLYERQTSTEQATESTQEHNGVGFNGVDAPLLSSFATYIMRMSRPSVDGRYPARREGARLTEKQRVIARRKLQKYAAQLARIANGEA